MKILVIDGQGGRMGRAVVEQLKARFPQREIIALGTNSIATSTMLKAGADQGATGENPVLVNAPEADLIIGPIGIVVANALLGEVTPAMAAAVGAAPAQKILIPSSRCNLHVAGVAPLSLSELVSAAVEEASRFFAEGDASSSL